MRRLLERIGLLAAAPGENTYHAFISYSHAVDSKLAPAVQRGLQRFAKPWYRAQALRIFRDQTGLSANPHLWGSIVAALDASQYFVLLASPDAAQSPWVAREIEYWLASKPAENILIALTDGELAWDPARNDFDPRRTTALPPPLLGVFDEEPRWVDLRFARTADDLSLHHPAFRDAIADLGSAVHGVPKDALVGEEVTQHRRTLRIARTAAAVLLALTAAAVVLALFALDQRDQAQAQSRHSASRAAAVEATSEFLSNPKRALLLAMEAFRLSPTPEARSALVDALVQSTGLIGFLPSAGRVSALALSEDGRVVSSVADDVRVRDARTGAQLGGAFPAVAEGPDVPLSIALSPDGKTLAFSGGKTVKLRHVGGSPLPFLVVKPGGEVYGAAFGPDGRRIAVVTNYGVRGYDATTGAAVTPLLGDGFRVPLPGDSSSASRPPWCTPLYCQNPVAWSGHGGKIAWVGIDGVIRVWRSTDGKKVVVTPGRWVNAIAISPDGADLASAGPDGSVRVWDTNSGRRVGGFHQPEAVEEISFVLGGTAVSAVAANGTVRLWNSSGELGAPLSLGSFPGIGSVIVLSPDGSTLVAADPFGTVRRWDVGWRANFGEVLPDFAGAVYSPDLKLRAGQNNDYDLHVWDVASGRERHDFVHGTDCSQVQAFSADDRFLASAGQFYDGSACTQSGLIRIWDLAAGRELPKINLPSYVEDLAFDPDGTKLLSVSADGKIRRWDVEFGREEGPALTAGSAGSVFEIALDRSGTRVLAAGSDGRVQLWDLSNGRLLRSLQTLPHGNSGCLAASPDLKLVASAAESSGQIQLWHLAERRKLGAALLHDNVCALAFSPDGRTLASGNSLGTVRLWDVQTGRALGDTLHQSSYVDKLAFSTSGGVLAVYLQNGTLRVWRPLPLDVASVQRLEARLCGIVHGNFTRGEWSDFFPGQGYHRTCPQFPVPAG